jgi:hypothetical protein
MMLSRIDEVKESERSVLGAERSDLLFIVVFITHE